MNQFPLWKNLLVLAVVLFGFVFALPNIYGESPAIKVNDEKTGAVTEDVLFQVQNALNGGKIPYAEAFLEDESVTVRFDRVEDQLQARDALREDLSGDLVSALTLAPRTPPWLRGLGLRPMSLGLDLRGGVHFLFQVDMDAAITQALENYGNEFRTELRKKRIQRSVRVDGRAVVIEVGSAEDLDAARGVVRDSDQQLALADDVSGDKYRLLVRMSDQQIRQRQDFAIEQNIVTLRNRVNELGVAEPVVQRQGVDRIVVQLPGVQDPTRALGILGATATLEFRMEDKENDVYAAQRRGRAPVNSRLYTHRDGRPVLLQREIIVTGDQLTDAQAGFDQNGLPAVFVKLDSRGAARMLENTKKHVGDRMGVVFKEQSRDIVIRDGEEVIVPKMTEEVISLATIQGVFSKSFQITGLEPRESRDLALLLRAGSLAAPIFMVEERTIGPTLGQENVDQGRLAVMVGFVLVVGFMILYYQAFGLIANLALLMNVVLIVALLSMLQASLTLPGIAGIVLTVGMAVDANVLIFERIREELRNGNTPHASIQAGYEKAFSSIADANITTLIAAIVLFAFGTGPIKGFAVTLSLGIVTSMFTAIIGTRAVVNLSFGGRKLVRLPI